METEFSDAVCITPRVEIWKDIEGYEGLYQVSNLGYVKSLARQIMNHGTTYLSKERILKFGIDSNGYALVVLSKFNKHQSVRVHRLVATAFVYNQNHQNIVNHIDGNKLNNVYTNLEWTTSSENNSHAYKSGLKIAAKKTGRISPLRKLTYSQAKEIKNLYRTNKYSRKQISKILNIPRHLINDVLSNNCYKEVE